MTVAIRDDLAEAHRLAWEHIAAPGSWFTGAERVELAQTVLFAVNDPDPLPPWVPATSSGRLSLPRLAPDVAHDIAYRIGRHAGTITQSVYRAAADALGDLPYVELCAIASTVAAVAHFCRNVGLAIPPLPDPIAGDPSGERPEAIAQAGLNWVLVAAPADQTASVVQAYTGVPGEQRNTWRMADTQYMSDADMVHPDWTRRPGGLSRAQMELVAARIALIRECFF